MTGEPTLSLKILKPNGVLTRAEAVKISAEAENGCFTMLPHHIDFVAALVPGLISWVTPAGEEEFAATDQGILVKFGREVNVSVLQAVRGAGLGELRKAVRDRFVELDEREQQARLAAAKLETEFLRRLTRTL